ncbi:hypothetical protein BN946_scf184724.g11 [Trametes cinnabarina]|uniref:Uncharacterized protein n=1 Tax=Pycnoporus cinnabarinus TaxID=5643 RepID=A0A060SU19_PYCCI|nr:hypothetical protein BN946_scf184724.g11 [Trametes cinnabarina]
MRYLNKHKKSCQVVKADAQRTYARLQDLQEGHVSKRPRLGEGWLTSRTQLGDDMPWMVPMGWSGSKVPLTRNSAEHPRRSPDRPSSLGQDALDESPMGDPLDSTTLIPPVPESEPNEERGTRYSRHGRKIRATWKVLNQLPEPEGVSEEAVPEPTDVPAHVEPEGPIRRVVLLVTERICSGFNHFGLRRFHKRRPQQAPSTSIDLEARYAPAADRVAKRRSARPLKDVLNPFPNLTSFLFAHHHASSSNKSLEDRATLQALLTRPDFNPQAQSKTAPAQSVPICHSPRCQKMADWDRNLALAQITTRRNPAQYAAVMRDMAQHANFRGLGISTYSAVNAQIAPDTLRCSCSPVPSLLPFPSSATSPSPSCTRPSFALLVAIGGADASHVFL